MEHTKGKGRGFGPTQGSEVTTTLGTQTHTNHEQQQVCQTKQQQHCTQKRTHFQHQQVQLSTGLTGCNSALV
jgi:hypothetical protein